MSLSISLNMKRPMFLLPVLFAILSSCTKGELVNNTSNENPVAVESTVNKAVLLELVNNARKQVASVGILIIRLHLLSHGMIFLKLHHLHMPMICLRINTLDIHLRMDPMQAYELYAPDISGPAMEKILLWGIKMKLK